MGKFPKRVYFDLETTGRIQGTVYCECSVDDKISQRTGTTCMERIRYCEYDGDAAARPPSLPGTATSGERIMKKDYFPMHVFSLESYARIRLKCGKSFKST